MQHIFLHSNQIYHAHYLHSILTCLSKVASYLIRITSSLVYMYGVGESGFNCWGVKVIHYIIIYSIPCKPEFSIQYFRADTPELRHSTATHIILQSHPALSLVTNLYPN